MRLEGAESCVATQKLAQSVETRLGRRVFVSASEADLSVEGHVARVRQGFHASLSVRDAKGSLLGTRELETRDRSCDALTESLVFALAVMIDPDATAPPPEEPPPPPPAPPAPPPSPPPPAAVVVVREQPAPAAPAPQPWGIAIEGNAAIALGVVPGAGAGASLAAVVAPPHFWAIRVGGAYFFDSSQDIPGGARATVSLAYGEALLCPLARAAGRLRVLTCAGAQVGSLQTRGTGFSRNIPDESLQVNVAAKGEVSLRLVSPLVLLAGVTALVPTTRDALGYTRADGTTQEFFRTSAVAAIGEVGVGLQFP